MISSLPIDAVLPTLKDTLRASVNAVLVAPPGAGKTTRVPLALLGEAWLKQRRIIMLEPRRLAARAAAQYMAKLLGEKVGETIGYRVRQDTCVGPKTRIEVVTEGVLTRLLQSDPALEDTGIIIFDEFHERSIHADLGLALSLQSQAVLRPDLKILVMSATLEAGPVAALLRNAPVITSEGQSYPVDTFYLKRPEGRVETAVTRIILETLAKESGDILVFLPGASEIRQVESRLKELNLASIHIAPLYGNLPQEAQDAAIRPCQAGWRKIVLATSIAETSLTVEGVQTVIDSGLMRVPRFSPKTGMTRLETIPVSKASADQRRGRAGRLGPGTCYRLWTEQDNERLTPRTTPELLEADLASLVLELAVWGANDAEELSWLNPPPPSATMQARELLNQLGALDKTGAVTRHGRLMAATGFHPRLAHMLLTGISLGLGTLACEIAALLGERDILRGDRLAAADIRHRVETIRKFKTSGFNGNIDMVAVRRVLREIEYWRREFKLTDDGDEDIEQCGLLLAFAYPDRIIKRRNDGRYLMRNGRGAAFIKEDPLSMEPYLVAAELDDQGTDSRIYLAAPIDLKDLVKYFGEQIEEEAVVAWDSLVQAVRARKLERLGALALKDTQLSSPNPDDVLAALLAGISQVGLGILPWTRSANHLRQRMQFIHRLKPEWHDVSDKALVSSLDEWLAPYIYGMNSRNDLERLNLASIFEAMLSWNQRQQLDELAPTHIVVPSGQRIPVDYSDTTNPVLAVRLQEMFGLEDTPRVGGGQVTLTLHLLSPAQRPVQITQDLASFWRNAYFEVRKDLLGRYPKHYWPENPLQATPTHRTRPRG